jgi:acetylornithine deacetylase/succinyl-diaminopimelate desuccinylase-like protein
MMDQQVLSWCKRLIGFRSVTREGTREIAEMCARELLGPIGIEARLVPSADQGSAQMNLFATIKGRDSSATPLVLNTHLDTVPPGDTASWTECNGDPFAATVRDNRIYGLGAADTKLDFVAKVTALAACRTPRRTVYLVGSFGEEQGLLGAKEIATAGLLPRGALAYVGEPSRLQVITAHKGLMVFELTARFEPRPLEAAATVAGAIFEGRAAHSSTPALGRNAITMALATLAANPQLRVLSIEGGDAVNKVPARCAVAFAGNLPQAPSFTGAAIAQPTMPTSIPAEAVDTMARFVEGLQQFADRTGVSEADYAPPTLTCNPGVMRTTKGALMLEFELRPSPALALEKVQRGVEDIIGQWGETNNQVTLELLMRRANPGFRSSLEGETVELAMAALARAGLPLDTGVKAGCTEAGIYAAAGLKPVVFGPGPSTGVIHAPNEYNFLADVAGAIAFYDQLLRL